MALHTPREGYLRAIPALQKDSLTQQTAILLVSSPAFSWYDSREVMSVELNLEGVVVGAASLLVIGAFHPLVIWCEYRFTQRVWPVFLIAGLLCLLAALLIQGILSILLGLLGAGCLWSIRELKEQAKRVERGWFPKNPKRK